MLEHWRSPEEQYIESIRLQHTKQESSQRMYRVGAYIPGKQTSRFEPGNVVVSKPLTLREVHQEIKETLSDVPEIQGFLYIESHTERAVKQPARAHVALFSTTSQVVEITKGLSTEQALRQAQNYTKVPEHAGLVFIEDACQPATLPEIARIPKTDS